MKKKFRNFIALALAVVLALPMWGANVFATENGLTESPHRLFVDGREVSTAATLGGGVGRKAPFNVDGTTYLAARAMSIAFGKNVQWEPNTSTLYFGQVPEASNLVAVTTSAGTTTMHLDQIAQLAMTDFTAQNRTVAESYRGVTFAALFAAMDIDVSNATSFMFVAADSFVNYASAEDVLNPENGWLALYQDGVRLNSRTRLVLPADGESGRWVRDVMEIIVVTEDNPAPWFREINIIAEGVAVNAVDAEGNPALPFMLNGKIYMPLRAVANALDMPVGWNGDIGAIFVGDVPQTLEVYGEGQLYVVAAGERFVVTMADILEIGLVETYAMIRGERRDYTGVPIASVIEFLGLDVSGVTAQIVYATRDGHGTASTPQETFDPTNGFIAIAESGVPFGHWEQGGRGPFMLVFAQDIFAQRFMRYLTEITIEGAVLAQEHDGNVLTITVGGQNFHANIAVFEGLNPRAVEAHGATFTAIPALSLIEHFGINPATLGNGAIVAPGGPEDRFFTNEELMTEGFVYIAFDQVERSTPFVVVYPGQPNGRRLWGLDQIVFEVVEAAPSFTIRIGGQSYSVTTDLINELGVVPFVARDTNFTGLPVATLISHFDIDVSNVIEGTAFAADGFNRQFTPEEMMDATNFFIAIEQDGQTIIQSGENSYFNTVFVADSGNGRFIRLLDRLELNSTVAAEVGTTIEGLGAYEFAITHGGQSFIVTMEQLVAMGTVDFVANTIREPIRDRNFTGVPLRVVFENLGIDMTGAGNLLITATDGFQTSFTSANALSIGYIVIGENGAPLGMGERGPYGPFFAVLNGMANNNWARTLQSIAIN